MKFVCSQEILLLSVSIVQKAVSSKNTLVVLGGIYLEATSDNKLILRATDLEMGIEHTINISTLEPGKAVLPARYFGDMVRRLPNSSEINMELMNDALIITYGKSKLTINCYPADEFPNMPIIDEVASYEINGDIFRKTVKQVSISTTTDHNRPIFTGILLEFKDNDHLTMVATDTHRLSLKHDQAHRLSSSSEEKISIIIPSKILLEISKLIDSNSIITLIIGKNNQVMFCVDATSIYSRVIQGQFPVYSQVIPTNFKTEIKINSKLFVAALERAALLANEDITKKKANNVKLDFSEKSLSIDTYASEVGNIHEELTVDLVGEEIEISFNANYLIDVLKVLDGEEILFKLTGPLSPAVIEPFNEDSFIYLVLPVRSN